MEENKLLLDIKPLTQALTEKDPDIESLPEDLRHIYYLTAMHCMGGLNNKVVDYIHAHPKYIDMKLSEILQIFKDELSYYTSKTQVIIDDINKQIADMQKGADNASN